MSAGRSREFALLDREGVRRVAADPLERALSSLLVTPDEATALRGARRGAIDGAGRPRLRQGWHVVMSACQDLEQSRELQLAGLVHGVFSQALLGSWPACRVARVTATASSLLRRWCACVWPGRRR